MPQWLDIALRAALPVVARALVTGLVAALTALGVLQQGGGVPVHPVAAPFGLSSSNSPLPPAPSPLWE